MATRYSMRLAVSGMSIWDFRIRRSRMRLLHSSMRCRTTRHSEAPPMRQQWSCLAFCGTGSNPMGWCVRFSHPAAPTLSKPHCDLRVNITAFGANWIAPSSSASNRAITGPISAVHRLTGMRSSAATMSRCCLAVFISRRLGLTAIRSMSPTLRGSLSSVPACWRRKSRFKAQTRSRRSSWNRC